MDDYEEDEIERFAAVEEILRDAKKISESANIRQPTGCVNKRLLSSSLVSTLRNPILPKSVKKRRHIGLDDEEEEDTIQDAKKRPDDGYSYDPSADYIYDARQYFDPEKYRKIVRNRNKKAALLEKRLKLRASKHRHDRHSKHAALENGGYKSQGNSRGFEFEPGSERYGSGESQEDCAVTVHRRLDETFGESNGHTDVTVAKNIRHKVGHKHKGSKKSRKHSNLSSSPTEVKSKTHRKHSKSKTEQDDANRRKKKKHGKSKRKDSKMK